MSTRAAFRGGFLAFLIVLGWLSSAHAWIETQVRGHSARIEVGSGGSATVRHELHLKIRGGPTKTIEIVGVGAEIQPLPDASVRRAEEGSAGRWPVHVSSMEDGAVRLGILGDGGLRGGNYVFSFAYELSLKDKKWIELDGDRAILTWIGPRLSSGVDSARVTFVVPRADLAPSLALGVSPSQDGPSANVLLGEVRRGSQLDEADLIRAHLASGEPAVWRLAVDAHIFDELFSEVRPAQLKLDSRGNRTKSSLLPSQLSVPGEQLTWVFGLAMLFGCLFFLKTRSVTRLGEKCDAKIIYLVPLPSRIRVPLAATLVAVLVWSVCLQRMVWALVSLTSALLISTVLLPVKKSRPRGPGNWLRIVELPRDNIKDLPGAMFDVRSFIGSGLFLSVLGALLFSSFRILPSSNYLALMVLLGLPLLLPLFFTGSRRVFPTAPTHQAAPWYRYFTRALDPLWVSAELWGRAPALLDRDPSDSVVSGPGSREWDEVRVRLVLKNPPHGLRALEVLLEEGAGANVNPCVLIRVMEDSAAADLLPRDIAWQRGRISEERVAVLRPTAPTFTQTVRLVRSLLRTLLSSSQDSSRSTRKSSGKSEVTIPKSAMGIAM